MSEYFNVYLNSLALYIDALSKYENDDQSDIRETAIEMTDLVRAAIDQHAENAKRIEALEGVLREILESGDWFMSALEFDHNVDGEELEGKIKNLLEQSK